jgi:hypothetical protein
MIPVQIFGCYKNCEGERLTPGADTRADLLKCVSIFLEGQILTDGEGGGAEKARLSARPQHRQCFKLFYMSLVYSLSFLLVGCANLVLNIC